jgi:hypothetical protein
MTSKKHPEPSMMSAFQDSRTAFKALDWDAYSNKKTKPNMRINLKAVEDDTDILILPAYVHDPNLKSVHLYDERPTLTFTEKDPHFCELHKFYVRTNDLYKALWERFYPG